jgi:hypothetical protein
MLKHFVITLLNELVFLHDPFLSLLRVKDEQVASGMIPAAIIILCL